MEHPKNKLSKLQELVKKTEESKVESESKVKKSEEPDIGSNINNPVNELEKRKRGRGRPKGSQNKNKGFRKKDQDAIAKAAKVLWEKKMVSWKLDKAQMRMYNSYKNRTRDELVWVVTRQAIGKSFCAAVIAIEECLNNPGFRIAYVSPQKSQTRDVVEKNINIILQDCPKNLRPKYDTQRGVWKFNNGSILKVAGIDGGHIESLRGQTFDLVFVDEAGFPTASDFVYAMESVIYPTMARSDNPLLLMFTTPPKSYDHPFNDYWEKAEVNGNLVFMTIYDSCLPPEEIAKIEERYGKDSVAFRREFCCERIADASSLVIPEATKEKLEDIVKEHKRPEFFKAYTSADYGVMDMNAILFGYHDFLENKLIIEDELVLAGQEYDTKTMAEAIINKELELWGENKKPIRYCDNNLQIIRDFSNLYNLSFLATDKKDKQVHINKVRIKIQNLEILINPKCVNLISHIQNAVWDKSRKNYKRALDHHYDFLDALIYMVRNVDYNHNPFPVGFNLQGDFISPKYNPNGDGDKFQEFLSALTQARKNRRAR